MKEFKVTQNYGKGTKAFLYFSVVGVPLLDLVERIAIKKAKEDWKKVKSGPTFFSTPEKARPTIKVEEVIEGKKVKNGINFKCKWR